MTAKEIVKYLRDVLNIEITSELVMNDILEDLQRIHDLSKFRLFIKTNFNNEDYKYLTGYQKFLALVADFQKKHKPKLTQEQRYEADSFTTTLFKKVCDVFDEVNWLTQTGEDIRSKKVNVLIYKNFGENEKELSILQKIGDREYLLKMVRFNKDVLEEKIKDLVISVAIKKYHPQLEHKTRDQIMIEKLKSAGAA